MLLLPRSLAMGASRWFRWQHVILERLQGGCESLLECNLDETLLQLKHRRILESST